jgi:hypothetical protein
MKIHRIEYEYDVVFHITDGYEQEQDILKVVRDLEEWVKVDYNYYLITAENLRTFLQEITEDSLGSELQQLFEHCENRS